LSGQFLQRRLFAAVDAILGAIFTSHTPKCNEMSQLKCGKITNCGLTILLSLGFPFAAYELRHSLDLAMLTKWPVLLQNGSGNPTRHAYFFGTVVVYTCLQRRTTFFLRCYNFAILVILLTERLSFQKVIQF